jgi:hypothetical protein
MTAAAKQVAPATLQVFEGGVCIGLIRRRPVGIEAAIENEILGVFASEVAAVTAVWKRAHGQPAAQADPVEMDLDGGDAA